MDCGFLTLSVFSFLYKDNMFYKIAENIFVGVSAAYWMVLAFWSTIMVNCLPKLIPGTIAKIIPGISVQTNYYYLISLVLGILLLTRLSKKYAWLSRFSFAFIVGFAAGFNLIGYLMSDFVTQIKSSIIPLIVLKTVRLVLAQHFSHYFSLQRLSQFFAISFSPKNTKALSEKFRVMELDSYDYIRSFIRLHGHGKDCSFNRKIAIFDKRLAKNRSRQLMLDDFNEITNLA